MQNTEFNRRECFPVATPKGNEKEAKNRNCSLRITPQTNPGPTRRRHRAPHMKTRPIQSIFSGPTEAYPPSAQLDPLLKSPEFNVERKTNKQEVGQNDVYAKSDSFL